MNLQVKIIPVTPFQQNCALIWNGATMKGAVIDPGGDVPAILKAAKTEGVTVAAIYLTHGHLDHAAGAADLGLALDVKIIGPGIGDKFLLDALPAQAKMIGVADAKPVTPDHWLTEGEKIDIGGTSFDVLHCPGHTPGHVAFIDRAGNFGILGDVLFRNSVGRTDFPYGSHHQLITAIQQKLLPLPDDFAFICGHGVASTIGAERRSNPFIQ